jgi:hypothetical protein
LKVSIKPHIGKEGGNSVKRAREREREREREKVYELESNYS